MKKLLIILSSIGLTVDLVSEVMACGNTASSNKKAIIVDDAVTNGEYDADSKTFIATYASNQYAANKLSFTIKALTLVITNIEVKNSDGKNVEENAG